MTNFPVNSQLIKTAEKDMRRMDLDKNVERRVGRRGLASTMNSFAKRERRGLERQRSRDEEGQTEDISGFAASFDFRRFGVTLKDGMGKLGDIPQLTFTSNTPPEYQYRERRRNETGAEGPKVRGLNSTYISTSDGGGGEMEIRRRQVEEHNQDPMQEPQGDTNQAPLVRENTTDREVANNETVPELTAQILAQLDQALPPWLIPRYPTISPTHSSTDP